MAVFYLDPENGNDTNNGTTFALRWKTIPLGATAARIAPGDQIRIIESIPSTDTGINATWTDLSPTVTLASALNVLITDCEIAWTGSANVTATASSTRRTGTTSASLAIADAFTTGKVAYFALGAAYNYSAYQGITYWLRTNANFAGTVFELRLCSDTTGDVAVDSFAIPTNDNFMITGYWPVYTDKGSALGSSIQSIAVYALTDPGTVNIWIDNISTVKAKGTYQTDNLNLTSLIRPGAGTPWWAIREINGTAVILESYPGSEGGAASRGFAGTTGSYDLLKTETLKVVQLSGAYSANWATQDSGTEASPIVFSGGWNRSDMSAQTGETWLDGKWGWTYGLWNGAAHDWITLEKVHFARWYGGFLWQSRTGGRITGVSKHTACNSSGIQCTYAVNSVFGDVETTGGQGLAIVIYGNYLLTIGNCTFIGGGQTGNSGMISSASVINSFLKIGNVDCRNCAWYVIDVTTGYQRATLGNIYSRNNPGGAIFHSTSAYKYVGLIIGNIDHSGGGQAFVSGGIGMWNWRMGTLTLINSVYGLNGQFAPGSFVKGLTTSGNSPYGWVSTVSPFGRVRIKAYNGTDTTPRENTMSSYTRSPNLSQSFEDYGAVADAHRVEYGGLDPGAPARITAETGANRHTLSGFGWKLSILAATYSVDWPFRRKLGKIYVAANTAVTLRIYVNRSNTGLTVKLVQPKYQINGVAADVVDTAVVAAGTWEELEITFTPTEAGVIYPELQAYGGSTYYTYFDDMTISQA